MTEDKKLIDIFDEMFAPDDNNKELVEQIEEAESLPENLPDVVNAYGLTRQDAIAALASRAEYWDCKEASVVAKYKPIMEAYQKEIDYCVKRKAAAEETIKRLLPPGPDSECVNEHVSCWYRASTRGEFIDPEAVPLEYCETKIIPNLKACNEAAKRGEQVPGHRLTQEYHLVIEMGGERAKRNAKTRKRNRQKKIIEDGDELAKLTG